MTSIGAADVYARASEAAFGKPLVMNVLRGHIVEAMVALALEPDWCWCAADYAAWDFERADDVRLEVKQSAVQQSWASNPGSVARPAFDVRERTGRWEGATWIAGQGRQAQIYLFCCHDVVGELADHRDPSQWTFYVAPTSSLPPVKRLGIGSVRKLGMQTVFDDLKLTVDRVANGVSRLTVR